MSEITVACVQMSPQLGEVGENLVRMTEFIEKIRGEHDVDLIVFPELCTTGYECGVRFTELAERIPGPTTNLMSQRASEFEVHLAFGMVVKEKVESIVYNAAILIGPDGEILGDYRALHPKGEQRLAFRPGYRLPVFETGLGRIGLMLGWDLAFPEVARSLALDGAELLVALTNWEKPNQEEWKAYALARAMENASFLAAANRVGEEYTYAFFGESMILGPRGQVFAMMDEEAEGYCIARINLDDVRRTREELQIMQCRQPQAYRSIVRRY